MQTKLANVLSLDCYIPSGPMTSKGHASSFYMEKKKIFYLLENNISFQEKKTYKIIPDVSD